MGWLYTQATCPGCLHPMWVWLVLHLQRGQVTPHIYEI